AFRGHELERVLLRGTRALVLAPRETCAIGTAAAQRDRGEHGERPHGRRAYRVDVRPAASAHERAAGSCATRRRRRGVVGWRRDMSEPRIVRAARGAELRCKGWIQEAVLRMLHNNLDPDVAERPNDLVVYGGTGKAARSWECFDVIVRELVDLADD